MESVEDIGGVAEMGADRAPEHPMRYKSRVFLPDFASKDEQSSVRRAKQTKLIDCRALKAGVFRNKSDAQFVSSES